MSDFTSGFWNFYIIVLTVGGFIFCTWILVVMSRREEKAKDDPGHVWDGDLTELNNPLPSWWRGLFWAMLIFSVGYLIVYPGLGTFKGVIGWTSFGEFDKEKATLEAQTKPLYDSYLAMSVEDLAKDTRAMGMAERLFLNNCAQCHGSDARGSIGFPNLRSGKWNWGGDPKAIEESIAEGRTGVMTPMIDILGGEKEVKEVVAYVRSLSGLDHDAGLAAAGKPLFEANCTACHGPDGKGMTAIGAPDLTDDIWLHGSSERVMEATVTKGRNLEMTEGTNAMPAHKDVLSPGKIHLLTAYVWGLTHQK